MRDKERGDSIGQSMCSNCDEETEREYFGFVPHHMMNLGPIFSWYESEICTECGSLTPLNIVEDDAENIEENYVSYLIEHDIIDEDEGNEWLNIEDVDNT